MQAKPTVLLLAAGQSARWRAAGAHAVAHKLDAPFGTSTVFAQSLTNAIASGLPVRVAVSKATPPTVAAMCRMLDVPTLTCSGGMGDVIAQAVKQTYSDDGWLIAPADMPRISKAVYAAVAQALNNNNAPTIAAPTFNGQRGHPVGFAAALRNELTALTGDAGARALLQAHPVAAVPVQDAGILLDIDTPGDLHAAENHPQSAAPNP
jgi:molybdenum cofactor cytidylyltransferase